MDLLKGWKEGNPITPEIPIHVRDKDSSGYSLQIPVHSAGSGKTTLESGETLDTSVTIDMDGNFTVHFDGNKGTKGSYRFALNPIVSALFNRMMEE